MRLPFLLLLFVIFTCRLSSQISIIGPATPTGDWDTDHDLIQSSSSVWTGTFVLNAGELKFRQDHAWTNNWGTNTFPSGSGVANGPSIPVSPAGVYSISFDTSTLVYNFQIKGRIGVNNTDPQAGLDILGGLRTRVYVEVVNNSTNTIYIPLEQSFVWMEGGTAPYTITIDAEYPDGTRIVLFNGTSYDATFGSVIIGSNKALEFIRLDGDFRLLGGSIVNTSSELEKITENGNIGWRLKDANPDNYGNIGNKAMDLSISDIASSTYGATGPYSVAIGNHNTASGDYGATAIGNVNVASGDYGATALGSVTTASGIHGATALGWYTTASGSEGASAIGHNSTAGGITSIALGKNSISIGENALAVSGGYALGNKSLASGEGAYAKAYNSIALGRYNDIFVSSNLTSWVETDPLLTIGMGTDNDNRKNAFTLYKNGNAELEGLFRLKNNGNLTGIELAFGVTNKYVHAGKIQYGGFGGSDHTLNILGGGTNAFGDDLKIKLWAKENLIVESNNFQLTGNTFEIAADAVKATGSGKFLNENFSLIMNGLAHPSDPDNKRVFVNNKLIVNGSPSNVSNYNFEVNGNSAIFGKLQIAASTINFPSDYKLVVDGKIIAEELRIQNSTLWPDFVFENGYDLTPLNEVEKHISIYKHLPDVPSAKEVSKEGFDIGEMQKILLRKIEELTLYIIEQDRKIKELEIKRKK